MVKSKKSFRVVWDIVALIQFKEILTFLEKQSIRAPKIVKKAILERINLIKRNPIIYEQDKLKQPENKDFRAFVVFNLRLTYQINTT